MTEDVDFSATVDEVKDQIRDLEDPDYQSLLQQEEDNKDRKTVKEFIQKRMDGEEVEIEEEDVEEELVEEIEEETAGGLLGGLSPEALLAAGVAGGLILGLLMGMVIDVSPAGTEITPQQAEQRLNDLYGAQFQDFEVTDSETKNGMFYISTNVTQEAPVQGNETNETQSQEFPQNFYMTTDGSFLFPEQRTAMGQLRLPIDVESRLEALQEDEGDLGDSNSSE
ncbi:MAG: hypothetical protein ACLFTA_00035 [Candidatus Nanohaloarchaea archaeon]